MYCCFHPEILEICEQSALCFHLGSTNYVAVSIYGNVSFIEFWLLVLYSLVGICHYMAAVSYLESSLFFLLETVDLCMSVLTFS